MDKTKEIKKLIIDLGLDKKRGYKTRLANELDVSLMTLTHAMTGNRASKRYLDLLDQLYAHLLMLKAKQ